MTTKIVLLIYIVICVGIAAYATKVTNKNKSASSYLKAGGSLGFLMVGFSVFGSTVGGTQFVGLTNNYYAFGLVALVYSLVRAFMYFTMGIFIAPKVYRLRTFVCNEFFAEIYRPRDTLYYGIFQSIVLIGVGGSQVMAGAMLLPTVFPSLQGNLPLCLVICALLFGGLAVMGGQFAVSATNALHTFAIVFCAVIVCIVGVGKIGGLGDVFAALPQVLPSGETAHYLDLGGAGALVPIGWFLGMWCQGYAGQTEWNAIVSAKNPREAKKGFVMNGIGQVILGCFVLVIAMIAVVLLPDMTGRSDVFASVATQLSPVFGALCVAAVFAATASTAQGVFIAESGVLLGWMKHLLKKTYTDREEFRMTRIFALVMTVVTFLFSLMAYDLIRFAINVLSVMMPFSILLVLTFYAPKIMRKSHCTIMFWTCMPVTLIFLFVPAFQNLFTGVIAYPLVGCVVLTLILGWIFDKRPIDTAGIFRTDEEIEADRVAFNR